MDGRVTIFFCVRDPAAAGLQILRGMGLRPALTRIVAALKHSGLRNFIETVVDVLFVVNKTVSINRFLGQHLVV